MRAQWFEGQLWDATVEVLLLPLRRDGVGPGTDFADEQMEGFLSELLEGGRVDLSAGATTVLYPRWSGPGQLVLVGLGERPDDGGVRDALADAAREYVRGASTAALDLSNLADDVMGAREAVEGVGLGAYRFTGYARDDEEKSGPAQLLVGFAAGGAPERGLTYAVRRGDMLSRAAREARDLLNEPANYLTPREFAGRAASMADEVGLDCEITGEDALRELGLEVMCGVAAGSEEPAQLIKLTYDCGDAGAPTLVLAGKGLTFDSGGISLKKSKGMQNMKMDMGGAAAVLAAMRAIAEMQPEMSVVGLIGAVENMPDGGALKPGDVLRACDGRTVEIISTDAEGRLVLADVVAYAVRELSPDWIVDVATLTGAASVALGDGAAPGVANDDGLVNGIMEASRPAGERFWQLPSYDHYRKQLRSQVADLKNSGGRKAGCITGGLFIGTFAEGVPWAHLDIAGVAWTERDSGWRSRGGTGYAARTLALLPFTLTD